MGGQTGPRGAVKEDRITVHKKSSDLKKTRPTSPIPAVGRVHGSHAPAKLEEEVLQREESSRKQLRKGSWVDQKSIWTSRVARPTRFRGLDREGGRKIGQQTRKIPKLRGHLEASRSLSGKGKRAPTAELRGKFDVCQKKTFNLGRWQR